MNYESLKSALVRETCHYIYTETDIDAILDTFSDAIKYHVNNDPTNPNITSKRKSKKP